MTVAGYIAKLPKAQAATVSAVRRLFRAAAEAEKAFAAGIPAGILFGIPEKKDAIGSASWSDDGVVQRFLIAFERQKIVGFFVDDVGGELGRGALQSHPHRIDDGALVRCRHVRS